MKKRKVTIIDYGMGNIKSMSNAFRFLNATVNVTNKFEKICRSEIVILPGVGSFHKAMNIIKKNGIDQALIETIKRGNFLLSVCLGMQLLGSSCTEDKFTRGLGIIKNKVDKFSIKETKKKNIPHVGFNKINYTNNNKLFKGINNGSDFYFVHSYRMLPEQLNKNISITNYGINFLSYFNIDNIYATQFHPEKSQSTGLKLLNNFLKLT
jgi:glutamine amidotransferase